MPARTRQPYSAPALEKGLDILELLAESGEPMPTPAIAAALDRSRSEIFRMLAVLETRGFIARPEGEEGFALTPRLLELAMKAPPTRRLLDTALPIMEALAERTGQSCHLGVASAGEMVVIARVESPDDVGFAVRIGHRRSLVASTSGRVLLAFQEPRRRAAWLAACDSEGIDPEELRRDLDRIVRQGYRRASSSYVAGIVDIGAPVFDGSSRGAIAALTIPCVQKRGESRRVEAAVSALVEAAAELSNALAEQTGRSTALQAS